MPLISLLIVFFASLVGIIIGIYINWRRRQSAPMVCKIGGHCDDVIYSKYATIFFGIPNELIGILYFVAVSLFYYADFEAPATTEPFETLALVVVTAGSLYSVFLIFIQSFVIKQWCEKCLVLASCSFIIFFAVYSQYFI